MTEKIKKQTKEDEIDLIALAKTLWDKRKFIITTVLICMCIGVAIALLSPKEYTASATMVPQLSSGTSSKLGGISSLAAMAGFNLDMNTSNELSPTVYPQIISSIPFQLEIMNTPFKFPDVDEPISYYCYFTEQHKPGLLPSVVKYTIGLPFVILKAIKGDKPEVSIPANDSSRLIALTEDQDKIKKQLNENIMLDVNDKEGYITLSAKAPDAVLAAQMAQKALTLLQKYITDIKIKKASEQLKFIEERYNESKKEFEQTQEYLARFRDKNKNMATAMAKTEEERLQSDYNLAFNVYSELAKQLEQSRIQEKEDTPVFSILKPVSVPLKDNKNGAMTLIIWTFLGGIIAIGWILGKQFLAAVKERWNEKEE